MQRNLGSVHEYRTEGITKADEREGENGSGAGSKSGAGSENEGQDRGEWRRGE